MYLIPFNTGVWGFSYDKKEILCTVELPEQLHSDSFLQAFTAYWCARKTQFGEIPHPDTIAAVIAFLAEEPNPTECVISALNRGKAVIRQFFPLDPAQRQLLRKVQTMFRYALRTSRRLRKNNNAIIDTVFNPRSITGSV